MEQQENGYRKFVEAAQEAVGRDLTPPKEGVFLLRGGTRPENAREEQFYRYVNESLWGSASGVLQGDTLVRYMAGGEADEMKLWCYDLRECFRRSQSVGAEKVIEDMVSSSASWTACAEPEAADPVPGGERQDPGAEDYEEVRPLLAVRPVCWGEDGELAEEKLPCRIIGDMALIPVVSGELHGRIYRGVVTWEMLARWGVSREKLWQDALCREAEVHRLQVATSEPGELPLVVLVTEDGEEGTAPLFYPGIAQKIGERLQGSYYVFFMSGKTVLCPELNRTWLPGYLQRFLAWAAKCPGLLLSKKLYKYEAEQQCLFTYEMTETEDGLYYALELPAERHPLQET